MMAAAAINLLRQLGRCMVALTFWTAGASAQDLEPRSYSNTPVGLNFLIAGYGYTEGNVALDPSVHITDADLRTNSTVLAYARSLGVGGRSAKFDVVLPYTWLAGSASLEGQRQERAVSGFGDPRFRFSMNFYGAPALSVKEFADYRQDLIIGASLQVGAPFGQYDASKLINIGTNRWSFKPELGISKAWDSWTVEVAPAVTFYTDNNDFENGGTLAQEPLYSVQGHLIHAFRSGVWLALDGTYYSGGRTTVNGVRENNLQSNTRMGLTVALPVDRSHSVKIYASTGTSSRTGSDFNGIGIAWQYRWGEGY
jgi:hypothetical protein